MILDQHLPEWNFQETFATFINADQNAVFQAIKDVKISEMAPAYALLFTLRFLPDRLFGKGGPRFAMDRPLMDQMVKGEPMPFIFLGEEAERRWFSAAW